MVLPARMEEVTNTDILVGKPQWKRQRWRYGRRLDDIVKRVFRELGINERTGFRWLQYGLVAGCCDTIITLRVL
jgi:hypothetical protein